MHIFLGEKIFWRGVLKQLIDLVNFLAERNLAFRESNETLGLPHNANCSGLFELLAKTNPVSNELQYRIIMTII